jgi:peptide/nickel transport system permease protein
MYKHSTYWEDVFRKIAHDKMAWISGGLLGLILLSSIFAPLLLNTDPYRGSMLLRLKPLFENGHILGTDELGRDMLTRLIYGGRISILMGMAPVIFAFLIGSSLGLLAGYLGGKTNMIIMRTMDVFYAFPSVLLAVAISGALGPGMINSLIALTIVFIPQIVRVCESATTQVRQLDFIAAAKMSGASSFSIIKVHVFPNVIGPVFVYTTSLFSVSMILGSGLSFLGLGIKPPEPEWGLMLNTLRPALYTHPTLATLPGLFIFITSISFNLLSDSFNSAMDIKK